MCTKTHGKNYINVGPPLVRHLMRNRLLIFASSVSRKRQYLRSKCALIQAFMTPYLLRSKRFMRALLTSKL